MDILFFSLRGSMYRYFAMLCRELPLQTRLLDFSPTFYYTRGAPAPSECDVALGIDFQLQRKRCKYRAPEWIWKIIGCYYSLQYRRFYRRFYYLIDREQPKCIALWNGHRLPEFAIKQLAREFNIPVVHFENGLLPNTTTFDLNGVNDRNSLPRCASFYRAYKPAHASTPIAERELVTRKFHRAKRAHAGQGEFFAPLPGKYIFVPFQVKFDSQILLNSPRIKTMYELYNWIEYVAENSCDNSIIFVIKEHPSDPHKYTDLYKNHPRIRFSNRDTQELITKSQAVVTVNSSVGLEALLLHRPVVVLGNACFAIEDLSYPVTSKEALVNMIDKLKGWQPDVTLIEGFLSYLKEQYCLPVSWRNPDQQHIDAVTEKFKTVLAGGTRNGSQIT